MACFQAFVSDTLLRATGLFRAKGFVWFEQQRSLHYIFHVSGKQRAECGATGKRQGPPGVQLVLIGQDQEVLMQLKQRLQGCLVTCCGCSAHQEQEGMQQATAAAGCDGGTCADQPQQQLQLLQQQQQRVAQHDHNVAAERFSQLVQDHHRFELWQQPGAAAVAAASTQHQQRLVQDAQPQSHGQQQQEQQQEQQQQLLLQQQGGTAAAAAAAAVMPGLVEFTAMGSALHGVVADEVSRSADCSNCSPSLLLFLCCCCCYSLIAA
jgi:hypothetical protein